MIIVKFRMQNIKHLVTTATGAASFPLSLSSSSSNQTPSRPPTSLLPLNGFNWLFRAWHSRAHNRSRPIKPNSSRPFTNLHDVFKALLRRESERETTLTNIWGSALSGRAADGEFNHHDFFFLLLPGWCGAQLSASLCVSACVFVSDFPASVHVCMHLCMNVSRW